MNVLVTGCGGDIGQSIGKILKKHHLVNNIIGCDISDKNPSKFIYDKFITVNRCTNIDYLSDIQNIITDFNIDLIIPLSEAEIRYITSKDIDSKIFDCPVIMANRKVRIIGLDKLKTIDLLINNGLPYPNTTILKDKKPDSFPFIVKSRTGAGSKSIFTAKDLIDFEYFKAKYPNYLAQEIIPSEEGEFTCGVFRSKNRETRTIIFKRELTGGYSGYGELYSSDSISNFLEKIADLVDLRGSINVQFRLRDNIPYIFEINPRFSSTVLFRHKLGFEDLIWSIEDFLGNKISDYNIKSNNAKFYKGFDEYIDF